MKVVIVLQHRFELWSAPEWFPQRLRQEFPDIEVVYLRTYRNWTATARCGCCCYMVSTARAVSGCPKTALGTLHRGRGPSVNLPRIGRKPRNTHQCSRSPRTCGCGARPDTHLVPGKKSAGGGAIAKQTRLGTGKLWHEPPPPREVAGATVGIVGFGSIGRELAKRAAVLGMQVSVTREHPEKGSEGIALAAIYLPARLKEMLGVSDYVVIAAPLTADTRGLINATRLSQMKPDGFLINVSRDR